MVFYGSFEILYKQSVMTEDVFLGLSDKDPSSAHCEAMVVRIACPSHRRDDIELDVKKQKLLLQSSSLKLSLYLPHPVRHQDGEAKWDAATQILTVSLPIIRDEW
jgi:dynein assembly factor 6, axonemal